MTVAGVQDLVDDGDITYSVSLNSSSSDAGYFVEDIVRFRSEY